MSVRRALMVAPGWQTDLAVEGVEPPHAPSGDQVVVEVAACGVCYRDCVDRAGRFPFLQLPITPGHEAAGEVVAVGPGVGGLQVGDRVGTMHRDHCGACPACQRGDVSLCDQAAWVFGLTAPGGYASHVTAPEKAFYRLPPDMSDALAATLHCTYGTAYRGLCKFGRPGPGDRVLVTGANGGVGSAAVEIAARLGAEVIAVVRREEDAAFVRDRGAYQVCVDDTGAFHKKLDGGRVDLALDCVGQPTFNASLRSLRLGGGLVVVGNVVEERVRLNLGYAIVSGLHIVGSSGATPADMAEVLALHAEKPFEMALHATLPLEQADRAQRMVRAGGLRGRIVLVP